MQTTLQSLSDYHLLFELLHDGKGNLYPHLEPIATSEIVEVLRARSGQDFALDKDAWVEWFTSSTGTASEQDKQNLKVIKKLLDMENHYIPRIQQANKPGTDHQ